MVRAGEIEHGARIASNAERIWNWTTPAGQCRAMRRARRIAESAKLGSDSIALELGCGTGVFTRTFAETGSRIVAIDVSPALLGVAQAKNLGEGVSFRIEDAEGLSFEDESFDAVIGSSVLHHLNFERAIGEIYRVLKPGGRIAFAEPNLMNPQIALSFKVRALRSRMGVSPEEEAFCRWRPMGQLEYVGFTDVRIEPFDFLHPCVPGPLVPLVRWLGAALEQVPLVREIAGSLFISATRR